MHHIRGLSSKITKRTFPRNAFHHATYQKLGPKASRKYFQEADCVCFDIDSTVITEEGIDVLAASCGKENTPPVDTAKLNLSFRAVYNGETLLLNQKEYNYNGNLVRFSKINFYISNLVSQNVC